MTTMDVQAEIIRSNMRIAQLRTTTLTALLAESDRLLWALERVNLNAPTTTRSRALDPSPLVPVEVAGDVYTLLRRVGRLGIRRSDLERTDGALHAIYKAQETIMNGRQLARDITVVDQLRPSSEDLEPER
jgi:hypothetical protein